MTTAPTPSASPETVNAVVIAGAAPCSANPWNKYPDMKPEQDGWYLVWCVAGLILETDTVADYEPHFEQAYWTGKIDDWESASSCAPLADGCYVTHWANVNSPNDQSLPQAGRNQTPTP